MASLGLRDRDAVVAKEGLIFRVLGYGHPEDACVCDLEYAPEALFKSADPRAFRSLGSSVFYKFYEDEGWSFLRADFPEYLIFHEMLGQRVIGVRGENIFGVRRPQEELKKLIEAEPKDQLVEAANAVLESVTCHSDLAVEDFGVFGSVLHGFHHPEFSDIDLVIYGRDNVEKLCETLRESYGDGSSRFMNEFRSERPFLDKPWRFNNYSMREFVWHQRRKLIYSLFRDENSGRTIKTEFEPVRNWDEISDEYDSGTKIVQQGWVKMSARIVDGCDGPFMPSIYGIEPLEVFGGSEEALEAKRVVSYMEEFRMQAFKDERVYVEGNLEKVVTPIGFSFQVALTYCPRYYEQVLKAADGTSPR